MELTLFPTVNATLNGISALLIATGRIMIRQKRIAAHRACMIGAVLTSSLFLACYLYYHFHAGSVRFQGQGWIRPVYFSILLSHTILAVAVVPLVLTAFTRGLRGNFEKHRAIARWAYPVWLYVSVTGVLIYVMLYHLYAG